MHYFVTPNKADPGFVAWNLHNLEGFSLTKESKIKYKNGDLVWKKITTKKFHKHYKIQKNSLLFIIIYFYSY